MKFNDVPINDYFRFLDPERSGMIHQRLSAKKIRDIDYPAGTIVYRRNEEVQHLGSKLGVALNTPIDTSPRFKDVPINYWFKFSGTSTAFHKMSRYKIRRFTDKYGLECRTRNLESVEIFGESMLDVPTECRH